MKNFIRHANEKSHYKQKNHRFSKHTFYGYCHYCHKFGYKDDDCRIKEEVEGMTRKEDTNISNGKIFICFICHSIGHFAKYCKNSTCRSSQETQKKVWKMKTKEQRNKKTSKQSNSWKNMEKKERLQRYKRNKDDNEHNYAIDKKRHPL